MEVGLPFFCKKDCVSSRSFKTCFCFIYSSAKICLLSKTHFAWQSADAVKNNDLKNNVCTL